MSKFQEIPIEKIDHAPFNPRQIKAYDPKIAELAQSISSRNWTSSKSGSRGRGIATHG